MAGEIKQRPRCPNGALALTDEGRHRGYWDCVVPSDHTLEDVLSPEYFGKIASDRNVYGQKARGQLCVGDIISIEPESVEWYVQVRLMAYNLALQRAVTHVMYGPILFDAEVAKGYKIRWAGRERRWCIERGDDLVAGGFASKIEANIRLEELLADGRRVA